jgi:hypothetical protein
LRQVKHRREIPLRSDLWIDTGTPTGPTHKISDLKVGHYKIRTLSR